MPHIVVEYSQNLEDRVDLASLLVSMHDALVGEGIDKSRLKTRATALTHSVVGTKNANAGQMLHITLLLLEGRDDLTKKKYGDAIHATAKDAVLKEYPDAAVTLEVRDMAQATYIL